MFQSMIVILFIVIMASSWFGIDSIDSKQPFWQMLMVSQFKVSHGFQNVVFL